MSMRTNLGQHSIAEALEFSAPGILQPNRRLRRHKGTSVDDAQAAWLSSLAAEHECSVREMQRRVNALMRTVIGR